MKPLILALCALILCQCVPKASPRAFVVAPPRQSAEVGPTVQKAKGEVSRARDEAVKVDSGIAHAVQEVARLTLQKSANEKELRNLGTLLTAEQARTAGLHKHLAESSNTIDQLAKDVTASEVEKADLRIALKSANEQLAETRKWQQAAEPKVAVFDWISSRMTRLLVIVCIVAVLWGVIRFLPIIIQILKPL